MDAYTDSLSETETVESALQQDAAPPVEFLMAQLAAATSLATATGEPPYAAQLDIVAMHDLRPGDRVILVEGPYQGTPGVLLHLRNDPNWVDLMEWNQRVRTHPAVWMRRVTDHEVQVCWSHAITVLPDTLSY